MNAKALTFICSLAKLLQGQTKKSAAKQKQQKKLFRGSKERFGCYLKASCMDLLSARGSQRLINFRRSISNHPLKNSNTWSYDRYLHKAAWQFWRKPLSLSLESVHIPVYAIWEEIFPFHTCTEGNASKSLSLPILINIVDTFWVIRDAFLAKIYNLLIQLI